VEGAERKKITLIGFDSTLIRRRGQSRRGKDGESGANQGIEHDDDDDDDDPG